VMPSSSPHAAASSATIADAISAFFMPGPP
jgi:hypothetical protein